MKKQMIAYQPCFYLNDKISYENPTTHHYVMSTISYNYTYKYTPAFTHTFNSIIKSRQNVLHCQILHVFFISTHKKIVTTFINNLHNFLNHEKLENRLYWNNQIGKLETTRKIEYRPLFCYSALDCCTLFMQYPTKYIIPQIDNYLICYLRTFLQLFILDYPASNTTINSSMSYHDSNIWETLFSAPCWMSTELPIIILIPS